MNREVVIDGSVSASWLFPDEHTKASEKLLEKALGGTLRIVVPELWRYEMLNVLRTAVVRERIGEQVAMRALTLLRSIPVEIVPAEVQGQTAILTCALRLGLSAYDAAYFSLAEGRGIDLVSADHDLLKLGRQFPWIVSVRQFRI